jgi:hypothetical protein
MTSDPALQVIATQDYGWSQLAVRAGRDWPDAMGWAMDHAVAAGIGAWEPSLKGAEDARRIGTLAAERRLAMPSVFVAGPLHGDGAEAALDRIVEAARAAKNRTHKSPEFSVAACAAYFPARPLPLSGSIGAQCVGSEFPPALAALSRPPQTPRAPSVHFFDPTMASSTWIPASRSSWAIDRKSAPHPASHPRAKTSPSEPPVR